MAGVSTKRSRFLQQAKASMVEADCFDVVVTDPRNQEFLESLPACLILNAADTAGDLDAPPGVKAIEDLNQRSQGLIRIYGDPEWETVDLAVEIEKLAGAAIQQLLADYGAFFGLVPKVSMTDIRIIDDPELEVELDRSVITIGVEYL